MYWPQMSGGPIGRSVEARTPACMLLAAAAGGARAAPAASETKAMKLAAALLLAHYGVFCGAAKPPAKPNVLTLLYVLA